MIRRRPSPMRERFCRFRCWTGRISLIRRNIWICRSWSSTTATSSRTTKKWRRGRRRLIPIRRWSRLTKSTAPRWNLRRARLRAAPWTAAAEASWRPTPRWKKWITRIRSRRSRKWRMVYSQTLTALSRRWRSWKVPRRRKGRSCWLWRVRRRLRWRSPFPSMIWIRLP